MCKRIAALALIVVMLIGTMHVSAAEGANPTTHTHSHSFMDLTGLVSEADTTATYLVGQTLTSADGLLSALNFGSKLYVYPGWIRPVGGWNQPLCILNLTDFVAKYGAAVDVYVYAYTNAEIDSKQLIVGGKEYSGVDNVPSGNHLGALVAGWNYYKFSFDDVTELNNRLKIACNSWGHNPIEFAGIYVCPRSEASDPTVHAHTHSFTKLTGLVSQPDMSTTYLAGQTLKSSDGLVSVSNFDASLYVYPDFVRPIGGWNQSVCTLDLTDFVAKYGATVDVYVYAYTNAEIDSKRLVVGGKEYSGVDNVPSGNHLGALVAGWNYYKFSFDDVAAFDNRLEIDCNSWGHNPIEFAGIYVCPRKKPAQPEITYVLGDVDDDGRIDSTDARMTLQYFVGSLTASELNMQAADVNGDDNVDSTDARLILQHFVGSITEFPVAE